jgi:GT2 family glycosyltransferase
MANKQPLVSVVILNWQGLEDTKLCLEYVFKLDYPNYEVIVLDNGSAPEQKEYLSKVKNIIYVDNPKNTGFAGGHDDALPYTHGDFILLLNNDAIIKSDYISRAIPLFDDESLAVLGGRAYFWNDDEKLLDESNRFYSYMNINPITAETTPIMQDYGVRQEVNTVSGSAVIVRRSVIDEVGYLFRPYFAYYEETDLFARIKRAGYKVMYDPALRIWHKNGASSGAQGGSSFFFYHIFRNRFMYVLRNFETRYVWRFLRSYCGWGLRAIFSIPRGPVQKRLGVSYAKAMATNLIHLPATLSQRKQLASTLDGSDYCQQMIQEQLEVSIVIDATNYKATELGKLETWCSEQTDPRYEFVIVVSKSADKLSSRVQNMRFITDQNYFERHPINLGCLAARNEWMIIVPDYTTLDIRDYIARISQASSSIDIIHSGANSSIAIRKSRFQYSGGFTESTTDLLENIQLATRYALFENVLTTDTEPAQFTDEEAKLFSDKRASDNHLQKLREGSKYKHFLDHHYRLQQLTSLLSWLGNFSIPVRLKLARLKNLVLFTATLRRKQLATELRHIKNESVAYSKDRAAVEALQLQASDLSYITSYTSENLKDIPVFIICFERVESLKKLVAWLESVGQRKIIFIDNDSTYKPLIDYYDQSPHQVIRLYRNIGHTAPWMLDFVRTLIPRDYYVVTDPDVLPTDECPKDTMAHLLDINANFPLHTKVGLGLKIDDLPTSYPLRDHVIQWEKQFWKTELRSDVFEAGVDTTFALYKPGSYNYTLHPSIRLGEPYLARHIPWYGDPAKQTDEDRYYKLRANANVTSWNVDELPERYQKEMKDGS